MFLSTLLEKIIGKKVYTRTLTYYLPAPPKRSNGYQEREFDQITTHLQEEGYTIRKVKMQSINYGATNEVAGVWILCLMETKSKALANQSLNIDYNEIAKKFKDHITIDPSIIHD